MMTKFEKRVLAIIMSALMCFSVTQIPMENVKAEEMTQENKEQKEINFPELNLGETYHQLPDEGSSGSEKMYKFIPEQEGRYVVSASTYMGINVYDSNMYSLGRFFNDNRIHLNAGQIYYLNMDCYMGDTKWRVDKAEEIEIQKDVLYTTNVGEIADYQFVPRKTGTYQLSFETQGECQVIYDSNMNKVSRYGTRVFLKAGETYYFAVKAIEEATEWKVEELIVAEGYVYNIKADDTVEILGYQGEESTISIPEIIEGKGVTSIGEGAFYYNEGIKEVSIPACIRKIANSSFLGSDIQRIEFAEGSQLKSIGARAFCSCKNLSSIKIPEGVEYLEMGAFWLSGITEIELPDSVTEVGAQVFQSCDNLQKVKIGSGLKVISSGMFYWCDSLTQVEFSDKNSVTKIEYDAFRSCSSLQELQTPDSIRAMGRIAMDETAWYEKQEDGVLYLNQILYGYKGEMQKNTEIAVKEGIKAVADGAFRGQANLTKAELPEGLEHIGKMSFYNCSSMNSVTIPESVTEIEEFAFGYVEGEWGKDILADGDGFYSYVRKMDDFTIYGVSGSAAQQYAEENGFDFVPIAGQIKGDVNGDGTVDDSDLQLVLRAICGKTELTLEQQKAADVEGDGNGVDSEDMRKILRFICGKIEAL